MPTYLVAIDFSKTSRQVLDLASAWAHQDKADLVLVHAFASGFRLGMVYEDEPLDPIGQLEQEMKLDEAVEFTTKWAGLLRADGLQVTTVAKEADAARLILEQAKEHDPDMIILGRAGHGAIREFFLGSTADAVVRRAEVPVVVVPAASDD